MKKIMFVLCMSVFLLGTGLTYHASEVVSKAGITFSEGESLSLSEKEKIPDTQDVKPWDKDKSHSTSSAESTKKILSQSALPQTNEKSNGFVIISGLLLLVTTAVAIKKRGIM